MWISERGPHSNKFHFPIVKTNNKIGSIFIKELFWDLIEPDVVAVFSTLQLSFTLVIKFFSHFILLEISTAFLFI